MALFDKAGMGDEAVSSVISPELEDFRMALRKQLVASRGSTYTYKNPDETASRVGARIGDDGTIYFNMTPNAGIISRRPGSTAHLPDDYYNDKGKVRRRYRKGGKDYDPKWDSYHNSSSSGATGGGHTGRKMTFKQR